MDILTVEEAAEHLRISRDTAYAMIRRNELPHVRLGQKRIIVPKTSLDEWLASSTRGGFAR